MKRKHKVNKWIKKQFNTIDKQRTSEAWMNIFKMKGVI